MMNKLEVSFNSPQCGWMSIGFDDGASEFHTTTAHAPHESALAELLQILTALLDPDKAQNEYTLKWNRDPEEFDFRFVRSGKGLTIEIFQYPDARRNSAKRELMFAHTSTVDETCRAFEETFEQLNADQNTDEFEFNWRQPFPVREFEDFKKRLN